jgi:hypothetical protein
MGLTGRYVLCFWRRHLVGLELPRVAGTGIKKREHWCWWQRSNSRRRQALSAD